MPRHGEHLRAVREQHVHHALLEERPELRAVALHTARVRGGERHRHPVALGSGERLANARDGLGHLPEVALHHEQARVRDGGVHGVVVGEGRGGAPAGEHGAVRVGGGEHDHAAGGAALARLGEHLRRRGMGLGQDGAGWLRIS
eukprot:5162099-Pyramimonas_sp.AAC.1